MKKLMALVALMAVVALGGTADAGCRKSCSKRVYYVRKCTQTTCAPKCEAKPCEAAPCESKCDAAPCAKSAPCGCGSSSGESKPSDGKKYEETPPVPDKGDTPPPPPAKEAAPKPAAKEKPAT